MKLKKFKSFKVMREGDKGHWAYYLLYIDFKDVFITFSKGGFKSKEIAQNFGHVKRVETNAWIPIRTSPET